MSSKNYYTYIYLDPRTSTPIYVGKGCEARVSYHLKRCVNKTLNSKLKTLKLLGMSPEIKILRAVDENDALEMESCLISMIGRLDLKSGSLCNFTNGGDGISGYKHTKDFCNRQSNIMKGKQHSLGIKRSKDWTETHSNRMKDNSYALKKQSLEHISKRVATIKLNHPISSQIGIKQELVTCPNCGETGGSRAMKRFHFEKCSLQIKQELVTCPTCEKTGGIRAMKRYHFENCKYARSHDPKPAQSS